MALNRNREELGRIVRQIWIDFAIEQADITGVPTKPHHLLSWDELDEADKEVDRRIGEALYKLGVEDMESFVDDLATLEVSESGVNNHD